MSDQTESEILKGAKQVLITLYIMLGTMIILFSILLFVKVLPHSKQWLIITLIVLFLVADIAWVISRQIFVSALEIQYSPTVDVQQIIKANRLFYAYAVFIAIYFACINSAYWVFTMKYWSLSHKIVYLIKSQSTKQYDRLSQILFYFGLAFILFGAIGYGWSEWTYKSDKNIRIFVQFCLIPLVVSCCFLTDAILRMRNFALSEQ